MKKYLLLLMLVPFSVQAQLKVQNDGGVVIAETSNSANTKLLVAPSTSLIYGGTQGDVTFEVDSDYTFETKGTFTLTKGVEIKLGAQLEVFPSEINY